MKLLPEEAGCSGSGSTGSGSGGGIRLLGFQTAAFCIMLRMQAICHFGVAGVGVFHVFFQATSPFTK